jgi:hypothetical protein
MNTLASKNRLHKIKRCILQDFHKAAKIKYHPLLRRHLGRVLRRSGVKEVTLLLDSGEQGV